LESQLHRACQLAHCWNVCTAAVAVGVFFARKASRSINDYFLAGGTLSWYITETSIVATTFSFDTPLVMAGISRQTGICGHWFWLLATIGQATKIFFFAWL